MTCLLSTYEHFQPGTLFAVEVQILRRRMNEIDPRVCCLQEPVKKGKKAAKRKVVADSDSDDDFVVEIEDDSDEDMAEDADFIDDDDDGADKKGAKASKASKKQKTASGKAAPVKAAPTPRAKAVPARRAAPAPAAAAAATAPSPRHASHMQRRLTHDIHLPLRIAGLCGSDDSMILEAFLDLAAGVQMLAFLP